MIIIVWDLFYFIVNMHVQSNYKVVI